MIPESWSTRGTGKGSVNNDIKKNPEIVLLVYFTYKWKTKAVIRMKRVCDNR
jgi:hypothetical protein